MATTTTRMPFMNLLLDAAAHRPPKRPRPTSHLYDSDCEMAFFAPTTTTTQHLAPPPSLARKRSERHLPTRNVQDDYSDLELSFASNVSLNSPPRSSVALPECEPMDISPMPYAKRTSNATLSVKLSSRGHALANANARLFGSDLSNSKNPLLPSLKLAEPVQAKTSGTTKAKNLTRSALPAEWLMSMRAPEPEPQQQVPTQPSSPIDDAMDVDTSYIAEAGPAVNFPSVPQSAAPTTTGFSNFFFDTLSPRRSLDSPNGPMPKKRRSLSPESNRVMINEASSSPGLPPSPSESKLDRMSAVNRNLKPSLQGLGAPSASFIKRPRRPVLSEMLHSSSSGLNSAYPILSSNGIEEEESSPSSAPAPRRAFSAMLPPSVYCAPESDSSFDADHGPDMSSPAQAYARRQQVKTIRRCDGTEDFRPLTGATAMVMKESPSSRHLSPGLPGFGDNEAHGKILPCHRVTEDGLMRITPKTLDELLDGRYDSGIHDYHIIDCRFDYEYAGGHIKGAVNINTTAAVEELLLGPSLTKPRPSMSGDSTRKTILVFHCEFSAKRAPTFAKHLRQKDRAMNNHNYPKIHYPEVYILEGGYCQYYKTAVHRCDPPAYVTMDDPSHATSRREDLDQFRKAKFGRHKSYAYGDGPMKAQTLSSQQVQPKRNTAPTSLFAAAATAARSRRAGSVSLMTLAEDANTTGEADHEDTDTDLGDSPCPPPTKAVALKSKKHPNRGLVRSETYAPIRMPF